MKNNNLNKIIIYSIIFFFLILISFQKRDIDNTEYVNPDVSVKMESTYNLVNSNQICDSINNEKIKIGVYSYYEGESFLNVTESCSNHNYYVDNLREKNEGESYSSWTKFGKAPSSYKYYIDDENVSQDKYYYYVYIDNRNKDYDSETGNLKETASLKPGEQLFIDWDIDDTFSTNDLRIEFNYARMSSDINISLYNSVSFYAYDENNKPYGPFKLDDVKIVGINYEEISNSRSKITEYKIVSENLMSKIPNNTKISKIRIVPYELYPVHSGIFRLYSLSINEYSDGYEKEKYIKVNSVNNLENVLRSQIVSNMIDISTFKWKINNTIEKLKYYNYYTKGDPLIYEEGKVYYGIPYTVTQQATILSFINHSNKVNGKYLKDTTSSKNTHFTTDQDIGKILYLYEKHPSIDESDIDRQRNLEKYDYISNQDGYLIGLDCGSSVNYAISKVLPNKDYTFNSGDYITSSQFEFIGDIDFNDSQLEKYLREGNILNDTTQTTYTDYLRKYYTKYILEKYISENNPLEKLYNSYAMTKPGDVLAKRGHARLITGNAHVVCNNGEYTDQYTENFCKSKDLIDPEKSYVVVTEISLQHVNGAKTKILDTFASTKKVGKDVHIYNNETIDNYINNNYTDITSTDDLYDENGTKKTNYNINIKYTFNELFPEIPEGTDNIEDINTSSTMYLAIRFKNMNKLKENKIEKPVVDYVIGNTENKANKLYEYLKTNKSLKGTLITNYLLEAIKVEINGKKYYIYPNQTHTFSFYNNDDSDLVTINNALNDINFLNNNIIKISVKSGPDGISELGYDSEGYIEVLNISSKDLKSDTTTTLSEVTKTYTGNVQGVSGASAKLNSNNSTITDAKFTYKYYTNSTCKTGEIETPTNAGIYYVQAILTETGSYNSSTSSCVKYTISKKKATLTIGSVPKLEVGKKVSISYTYDGDGTVSCTSSDSSVVKCGVDTSNKKITLELLKQMEKNVTITIKTTEGTNYSKADDKSITLTISGETKLSDILKNNNYSINNNYVLGITVGSSVSELKSKLGNDVTIESTKTIIATGTIIKKGNESYTVVIKGDINGDGKIGSLDYVSIRKYIMGDKVINSNSLEFMAADIYEDNEIKAMDYIIIRKIIMENN